MREHRAARRRAFTLIEVTTAIAVLGAIAAVVSSLLLTATDGYLDATVRAQLHGEIAVALDRCSRELRAVDQASGTAPDVDSTTAESIAWEGNCSLALVDDELQLTIDGAMGTLLTDVSAFAVSTFDESNVQLASDLSGAACDPIRRVALTITLQRHGTDETLRSRVFLRSMLSGVIDGE